MHTHTHWTCKFSFRYVIVSGHWMWHCLRFTTMPVERKIVMYRLMSLSVRAIQIPVEGHVQCLQMRWKKATFLVTTDSSFTSQPHNQPVRWGNVAMITETCWKDALPFKDDVLHVLKNAYIVYSYCLECYFLMPLIEAACIYVHYVA